MNTQIGPHGGPARTAAAAGDTASAERLGRWEATAAAGNTGPRAPLCGAAGQVSRRQDVVEAEVVRCLPGGLALVRTPAGIEEVGLGLVAARPGEQILVHAGEVIGRIGAGAARTGHVE
ncbi:hydrogenase assembly protein HupF [Frankia sp. AgKG'84/4]|uniref:hydrogenase assembly protein HupF n=1 Tax=Frankia sp. AgKG'84/4 TaxID=573490 RepID=UPI00200D170A|nr:hydrogenase assembly protein HupF [Frankia sp. AgKG'84/4]MCL9794436.1 hydrogenase assembly protein HupF [Frankia sp. AgKG'84/4]